MPPKTRALAISATASLKLLKERVPGRTSEVTVKEEFSPNWAARIAAAEPLTVEWPEGYSGGGGVPGAPGAGRASSQGSQVGSAVTTPATPVRMAVMGLQKT